MGSRRFRLSLKNQHKASSGRRRTEPPGCFNAPRLILGTSHLFAACRHALPRARSSSRRPRHHLRPALPPSARREPRGGAHPHPAHASKRLKSTRTTPVRSWTPPARRSRKRPNGAIAAHTAPMDGANREPRSRIRDTASAHGTDHQRVPSLWRWHPAPRQPDGGPRGGARGRGGAAARRGRTPHGGGRERGGEEDVAP